MSVEIDKVNLRRKIRAERLIAFSESAYEASQKLSQNINTLLKTQLTQNIAGYWAVGSEIDLTPLLGDLDQKGCIVSLPVVVKKKSPKDIHKIGDIVSIQTNKIGRLTNRVNFSHLCEPWVFGSSALIQNLSSRKLI